MFSIFSSLNRWRLAAVLVALLAACGGNSGVDGAGGGGIAAGTESTTPAPVVKVEITQKGLLFTAAGQSSQLTANATDANGRTQNVPVTWLSNKPHMIAVDATGMATAQVASGSGQIVARVAGIQSAPMLVVVTAVAPGAVLLKDSQIVGNPVETSPGAEPSLTNTFQIFLGGVAPPAIGSVLINTESKPVGGRVVAVDTSTNPVAVTLQMVPAREMFPTLEIQETIDLSNAEITIPPEVLALYSMVRAGNTFTFTPKPTASASAAIRANVSVPAARRQAAAPVKFKLGVFDCEITATGLDRLPVTLTAPPTFSVTASPKLDISLNLLRTFGFDRLVINAEPTFAIEGGLSLAVGFDGKVECKKEIFAYVVPAGGPLALIIGGVVPMGIGMEAAGKVTAATLGIGSKAEFSTKVVAGINCPSFVVFFCEFEGSTKDSTAKFTPTIDLPSIGDIRLEPSLSMFGYLEATIGNVFFKSLRFEFVKAKVGATLAGSFALKESQLADTSYASSYKVSLDASVGTGAKMGAVLQVLGVPDIAAAEIKLSTDIAKSPKGLAVGAVVADKTDFVAGDVVNVTVKLDPATVDFLPVIGPYNVKRVQLVRKLGTDLTIVPVVASADASPGQTEFKLSFKASSAGNVVQLSAFVVSVLAPFDFLSLEAGTITAHASGLVGTAVVSMIDTTQLSRDGSESIKVERFEYAGPVQFDALSGRLNISSAFTATRRTQSLSTSAIDRSPCFFDSLTDVDDLTNFTAAPLATGYLVFSLTGDAWSLRGVETPAIEQRTITTRRSVGNVRGDCTGFDFTSSIDTDARPARTSSFDPRFSILRSPSFQGVLLRDATGLRSLSFSDNVNELQNFGAPGNLRSIATTLQLNLTE